MKFFYGIGLFLCLVFSTHSAFAQQSDRDRGIGLYKNGEFAAAITALGGNSDPTALHYLGLAYEKTNNPKEAFGAFEQSFKMGYETFERGLAQRADIRIKTDKPGFTDFLKNLRPTIQVSISSAERAYGLRGKRLNENWLMWMRAKSLVEIAELADGGESIFAMDEVDSAVKITKRSRPSYTDSARMGNISGKVLLLVGFGADGLVKFAIPLVPLPNGLTAEAVLAAKRLKFKPAKKNGNPVLAVGKYEVSFSFG